MPAAVSVICTFLNAEDTLEATLASLDAQTATDARFILVDDGSSDRSGAIAAQFCSRSPRFALYRNPMPGRGRALNLAVERADSDYVAILDADDLAHPCWLEDGVRNLGQQSAFAGISFERVYIRDDQSPDWTNVNQPADGEPRDVTRALARGNILAHSGVLLRKAELVAMGGYDASRSHMLDYDLWIRLVKNGRRLGLSQSVRIAKRYHGGQKFARMKGYSVAAWREQLRAIMEIDPNYRNFLWLALRIARESTRGPRHALAARIWRR